MLNFIYNPTAGKGKALRFREAIEAKLKEQGVAYSFWETKEVRDASRIARELTARGETDIIAMGGDGTVNEVLNGLTDPSKVNLGLIPCGSGNDFAAAVGIPVTPEGSLEILLNETPKFTDYMECSGVRGLNVIGAGIDVDVLKRCYKAKYLKGSLNYLVSLIVTVIFLKFYQFSATLNGKTGEHNGLIVCACNGRRFGGGMSICPDAAFDDGLLDVVLVENVTRPMVPGALVHLATGKILKWKNTLHERAPRLQVQFHPAATIQIDGELYDDLPFDVQIVHNQLKMYRR